MSSLPSSTPSSSSSTSLTSGLSSSIPIPASSTSADTSSSSSSITPFSTPTSTSTNSSSSSSTSSSSASSSEPSSSSTSSITSQSSPSSSIQSSTPTSSSSASPSSSSVLTAPVTTVIQTTVITTSNGQVFTTVFSTQSTAPAGATVSAGSDASGTSHSTSHTGAIVGGAVGGTVGLLLLVLGALWYIRRRRRLEDETFDGDFDPDRIVRPSSGTRNLGGRLPTLPSIPVTNSDEQIGLGSPEMAQMEDDGMGGRLNASTIGAGVVTPYPLYASTPSVGSPPPSARSWGNSSDAQHSVSGHMPDWRGPSPGPSIPTQYTGSSAMATPPSSYPSNVNIANLPPGAAPGAAPGASAYSGTGRTQHGRRYSAGTASSGERQPIYAGSAPGSASGGSTGGGSIQNGGSHFAIANPDDRMVQNRYAGGYSEGARRAYIVGGPGGKSPGGPSQPRPREVLVHEDGGRIANNDPTPESEGPEEIPPTYDSLLGAAGMARGSGKEHHS